MIRMRLARIAAAFTSTLIAGALLAACSASGGAADSAGGSGSGGTVVKGGTIVYAAEQEPPCLSGGWLQEAYIARNILDSLVTEAGNGVDRALAGHVLDGIQQRPDLHLQPEAGGEVHRRHRAERPGRRRQLQLPG